MVARYYPNTPTDFQHFAQKVRTALKGSERVLDLGAGAGIIDALDWRGEGRRVFGIDLDPRVGTHPHLDWAAIANAYAIPFPDGSFDAVVSVNVFEHIPDPPMALREIARVLRPGGRFYVKTPNRQHYVGRIADLTPTAFHEWYNSRRGRAREDTFPTTYRFNRFDDIERSAGEAGLQVVDLDGFEGVPEYLLLSAFLFIPGLLYERWANGKPKRKVWRACIEAVLQKPELATAESHR